MDDGVHAAARGPEPGRVTDISLDDPKPGLGLQLASVIHEVIDRDVVPLRQEQGRQHGTDVTGAAGDQDFFHGLSILGAPASCGRLGTVYPASMASRWNIATVSREYSSRSLPSS